MVEQEAINDADLVINATPLGMNENEPIPIDVNLLGTGQCVVDLIYKPEKNKAFDRSRSSRPPSAQWVRDAAISSG